MDVITKSTLGVVIMQRIIWWHWWWPCRSYSLRDYSVYLLVRIGSPRPLSRKRMSPRETKGGGGQHSIASEEAGGANSDD